MPDSIAGIVPATQVHGSVDAAMSALGGMDSQGFLKLLVAQLQYQSPMEPKDPGDMMMQTATLAQLDATQQLLALQRQELGMQQAVAAAGLLGAEVTAVGADGPVSGTVDSIRYTASGPVLDIGGREVLFHDVHEVRRPSAGSSTSSTPPATSPATPSTPTTDA